jgi:hypothetical protein
MNNLKIATFTLIVPPKLLSFALFRQYQEPNLVYVLFILAQLVYVLYIFNVPKEERFSLFYSAKICSVFPIK